MFYICNFLALFSIFTAVLHSFLLIPSAAHLYLAHYSKMPTSLAQCCDCYTSVLHSPTFCAHRTHFFSSSSSSTSESDHHPARSRRCSSVILPHLPLIFIFFIIILSSSTSVRAFPSRQNQQRHHPFGISPLFSPAENEVKDAEDEELVVTVVDEPLELAADDEDDDEGRRRDDSEEAEAEKKQRKTAKNARRDLSGVGGADIEVGGANARVGVADSGVGGASADTTPKAMARSHAELFRRMRSICSRMHTRKRAPKPGSPESLVAFLCHNTNIY